MVSSTLALVSFNAIPERNDSFKYERLGPMAVRNHRQYCDRHGYTHWDAVPEFAGRPACWGKITALLEAMAAHQWVLWADSDALVLDPGHGLEAWCDPAFDLVCQCPRAYFERIGVDPVVGMQRQPVNTGVFLLQSTDWSRQLLCLAYERTHLIGTGPLWNGIGDQEALIEVLHSLPDSHRHCRHVADMQCHPALYDGRHRFVHFYGNHARHLLELETCEAVLRRWERAIDSGAPLPRDLARLHWCCIQNKQGEATWDRGGPERFLYEQADLWAQEFPRLLRLGSEPARSAV